MEKDINIRNGCGRILVTGCNGQLGRAVKEFAAEKNAESFFDFRDVDDFDLGNESDYLKINWSHYDAVINCAAYTAVDKAETPEGRIIAWRANATGPALLSRVCSEHNITLVHISSDYVFDGTQRIHLEDEPFSPLSVYGQSKAAGDLAVAGCPKHYILRSSWVIGDGNNFVKTMKGLSDRVHEGELNNVMVVDDQFGRLTFTQDMVLAIFHLLSCDSPYGTYNMTGSGAAESWAGIARKVFQRANANGDKVIPVSTSEYYASTKIPVAPRPRYSTLKLDKLEAVGFPISNWECKLNAYLDDLISTENMEN